MRRLLLLVPWSACSSEALPPLEADAALSCECQLGPARLAGAVTMDGADELSGLAVSTQPDLIWAHNDGNKDASLFALTATGAAKGVVHLTGAVLVDPEDLAIAPCTGGQCLYLADTGDNDLLRTSVQLYEIDEPLDFRGVVEVGFRRFDVSYPDGPHDAEALFVDPRDGASYVITKQRAPSTVFRIPREAATATAVAVATFTVPGGDEQITAADLRVDDCGVRLLIRTYSSIWELAAPAGTSIADLFATVAVSRPVAVEAQGEAIAFTASGHGYVTVTDGVDPRISRVTCE